MAARQSAEVTRALRLVAGGMSAYAAAKKTGIALSTIYRARKRKQSGLITVAEAIREVEAATNAEKDAAINTLDNPRLLMALAIVGKLSDQAKKS